MWWKVVCVGSSGGIVYPVVQLILGYKFVHCAFLLYIADIDIDLIDQQSIIYL